MANTIVQLHSLPSLGALTLRLYPRIGGAIVNGAGGDAMAESDDTPGLYAATVAEPLSGIYAARVYSGSDLIGSYLVDLRDTTSAYDLADPAIASGVGALALTEIGTVAGGGGGGSVALNVVPSVVSGGEVDSGPITAYVSAKDTRSIVVADERGEPISLDGETLEFIVERTHGARDVFVKTSGDGVAVAGEGNNLVTISYATADVSEVGDFLYALRRAGAAEGKVFAEGCWIVKRAALKDADA